MKTGGNRKNKDTVFAVGNLYSRISKIIEQVALKGRREGKKKLKTNVELKLHLAGVVGGCNY